MRWHLALLSALSISPLACGGSPPPAPASAAAPAPAAAASADGAASKDDPAKKAAAIDQLTAGEAKSGACDPQHQAALEKLLSEVESAMKAKTGDDGKKLDMSVVGKRVLALGPSARGVEMSVTGRGTEVHVIAFAVKDVSMDVLAGTTAATTMRSPYAHPLASPALDLPGVGRVTEIAGDSRQVTIKPGQPLQVKLTGQGCAALVTFLNAT